MRKGGNQKLGYDKNNDREPGKERDREREGKREAKQNNLIN